MEVSYQGLWIELPWKTQSQICSFWLKEGLNQHGEVRIEIQMEEEEINATLLKLRETDRIVVKEGKEKRTRFVGMIKEARTQRRGEMEVLELEGVSFTFQWDLAAHSQSYGDLDATYEQVTKRVLKKYEKAQICHQKGKHTAVNQFLLQYEETDWEFLKRLASHFETFLCPDHGVDYGRVFFGLPSFSYGSKVEEEGVVL